MKIFHFSFLFLFIIAISVVYKRFNKSITPKTNTIITPKTNTIITPNREFSNNKYHYSQFIKDVYFITNNKTLSNQYDYFHFINTQDNTNIFEIIKHRNIEKPIIIVLTEDESYHSFIDYQKNNLYHLINNDYDIVHIGIHDITRNIFQVIDKEIKVYPILNLNYDTIFIKPHSIDKLLNPDIQLNIGYFNRPLFIQTSNQCYELWKKYYQVTDFWDEIYCFNLSMDIEKKQNMLPYCYLFNHNPHDFFYQGHLGTCLPSLNKLIDMNIYHPSSSNYTHVLKSGTIGLNVSQLEVLSQAFMKQNKYTFILEDDIYVDTNYFLLLYDLFHTYKDIDILLLGHCLHNGRHSTYCDQINNIQGYDILIPKQNISTKISMGGFYGVLLSNKALKVYLDRFNPINNISDVLLCDLMFEIKKDFSDTTMTKTNHGLKSYIIHKHIQNDVSRNAYGLIGVKNKNGHKIHTQ